MFLVVESEAIDHAGTGLIGSPHLDLGTPAAEFQDDLVECIDR